MRRVLVIIAFFVALAYFVFSSPQSGLHQASSQGDELTFWGIYDLEDVYQPVIEAFQKQYPNIQVHYRQFPNREEYQYVLDKQFERGQGPDIFLFPSQDLEKYQGYINPTNTRFAEGFSPMVQDQLVANRLLFGVPLWLDTLMLYYNKQYYPDGIANKWYDFAEQTRNLNLGGVAMGRLDNIKTGWDILAALFLQKDVQLKGTPENALFDTLEFFIRFAYPIDRYFNWSETLNKNYPDAEVESFAREKVAAIAGYSSVFDFVSVKSQQLSQKNLRHISSEDIGVATFPQFDPENPKYLAKMMVVSVSIYSQLPNQAWDFVELLTDKNHAEYFFDITGRIPGRILSDYQTDSQLKQVQLQQAQNSYAYTVSESAKQLIEPVVEKGLKDKRLLREIFNVQF